MTRSDKFDRALTVTFLVVWVATGIHSGEWAAALFGSLIIVGVPGMWLRGLLAEHRRETRELDRD